MSESRRDFIAATAASTAALTLGPLLRDAVPVRGASDSSAADRSAPISRLRAHPIPLDRVRLTGGPLKHAQDLTAAYLLALDPDRMLSFYRQRAGLPSKAAPYAGWDGGGRNLTGHIAGHHLSAVSYMYQATGDVRFKTRADYIVRELEVVQRKNGDGYVGALEGLREAFARLSKGEIKSGGFDLNGLWSPWYTLHKTYAGLRDAYRHTANSLALKVETAFAEWAERVLAPLDEPQMQRMLNTEHGGMNEILADLYADTGSVRWLLLSQRFEHQAFTTPLKRHEDNLSGKHGNCQIPKLIGSAARYEYTGDADDLMAAAFFWDRVVRHHTYASGGHGLSEYFGPPDRLSRRVDGRAAETCNVYNMVKLSRQLFAIRPDAAYADFHERALFNHILASIDPTDGRVSYMVPVGRDEQQEYQDPQRDFTCCVGTGMESHALHGLGVFFESADTIWLNQFVPCEARSTVGNTKLLLDTNFPDGDVATLRVTPSSSREFTLAVRRPVWAGDGFRVAVNGAVIDQPSLDSLYDPVAGGRAGGVGNESERRNSTYVRISREWKSGDTVTLTLPKSLHLEPTPDDPTVTAIMWGPLALAADVAPREEGEWSQNPSQRPATMRRLFLAESRNPKDFVAVGDSLGKFIVQDAFLLDRPERTAAVQLTPFYRTHRRRYALYHDVVPVQVYTERVNAHSDAKLAADRLEAMTVSKLNFGDVPVETAHSYQSDPSNRPISRTEGRTSRVGAGWFSVQMLLEGTVPMDLVVTYFVERGLPAPLGDFHIAVDGTTVATYEPNHDASGFYQARYELPWETIRGKSSITVRFEAEPASSVVPVFEIRTIKR